MSRWFLALVLVMGLCAQGPVLKKRGDTTPQPTQPVNKEGLPPEEDAGAATTKEYAFNPIQAKKEISIGDLYFKKGSYRAAAGRYSEATKWNSGDPEAWLRLGEAQEKLRDAKAEREAYNKYLELATDAKDSKKVDEIRKKLEHLK
jgi:tetratricopeptide (TPR) repeat protein